MIRLENMDQMAHLSRIALTQEERIAFSQDLSRVFEWIAQLDGVCFQKNQAKEEARCPLVEDIVKPCPERADILANGPDVRDGFFVVPQVG